MTHIRVQDTYANLLEYMVDKYYPELEIDQIEEITELAFYVGPEVRLLHVDNRAADLIKWGL